MKIFFHFTDETLKTYKNELSKIYNTLKKLGYEDVVKVTSKETLQHLCLISSLTELTTYIREAKIIIFEISRPSITQGYYIKMALEQDKPVILLYRDKSSLEAIFDDRNEKLQGIEYNPDNIYENIKTAIEYAKDSLDIRFNLFISPELNTYLKWAAKEAHSLRSNFIRSLIIEHKNSNLSKYLKQSES